MGKAYEEKRLLINKTESGCGLRTGLSAGQGMELEMELERRHCYGSPFMLQVSRRLAEMGKKIIITSDMYLSREFLQELLAEKGFAGAEKLYISNEWGGSKHSGRLYELEIQDSDAAGKRIIHIGDNERSDIRMAQRRGVVPCCYPNVHKKAMLFRAFDMSPIVGAAYRGIVDSHLYSGLEAFSPEYEYGYVYGGLFAVGYCSYIHEYCRLHRMDKVLFLSRDGDILRQVYRLLSSPTRQFTGFGFKRDGDGMPTGEPELYFGKYDENQEGIREIREIQRGILDFAGQYLKAMEKRFHLDIQAS